MIPYSRDSRLADGCEAARFKLLSPQVICGLATGCDGLMAGPALGISTPILGVEAWRRKSCVVSWIWRSVTSFDLGMSR